MNHVRWFRNTEAFASHAEAAAYLARVMPVRAAGYEAPDGTIQLSAETTTQNELTDADDRG